MLALLRQFRAWLMGDIARAVDGYRAELAVLRQQLDGERRALDREARALEDLCRARNENWQLTRQIAELKDRLRIRSGA